MSTLVERLRAEAERLSGSSIRNGCPDCGIAANVAEEAADALSARPTPPAEIVRYEPMVQPFRGEDVVTMAVVNFGQWVRYEDHAATLASKDAEIDATFDALGYPAGGKRPLSAVAKDIIDIADRRAEKAEAALAAERAARIEAEEALRRIVEECGAHPNAQAANRIVVIALTALGVIDQPKGDAA